MPDRFYDGNQANNSGGNAGGPAKSGFDPAGAYSFHGGDLKGIQDKLGYLAHLGITSIWMTPIFRNRAVQSFEEEKPPKDRVSWILDSRFYRSRPSLRNKGGSSQSSSMRQTNTESARYSEIVVNHTADVIEPKDGAYAYQYKFSKPYEDANGKVFDDRDYIDSPQFPKLDETVGFAAPPTIRNPEDRHIKIPAWLNDPTVYHNRGDSQTGGESALYGDVAGLDDLFTEQPRVVQGMIDIYDDWIANFAIAGFRLDTVKHVNNEFWQRFVPSMQETAARSKRKDFFIFGEI